MSHSNVNSDRIYDHDPSRRRPTRLEQHRRIDVPSPKPAHPATDAQPRQPDETGAIRERLDRLTGEEFIALSTETHGMATLDGRTRHSSE